MTKQDYNICLCTDDNYAKYCGVTLCSLFENNKDKKFTIHILINNLQHENLERLKNIVNSYNSTIFFHKVDSSLLKGCQYRKNRPLTEAAYYRVLLSTIIPPNIDKVLYLDCDIIVIGDITELFNLEIEKYPLAAVQDPELLGDEHRQQLSLPYGSSYFNSGVLLINLKYWRDNNCQEELINFSKRDRKVFCHDQDALNYVFKKEWFRLPPKWNKSNTVTLEQIEFFNILDKADYIKDARIIHYIDEPKPWYGILGTRYRKLYKSYQNKINWSSDEKSIPKNRILRFYKRVIINRCREILYYIGFLSFFKNIKFIWMRK